MKLLKLFFLIFLTILLSLVIQIPTYLGMNYFENNTVCKILIGLAVFLLIFGVLSLIRRKCFPNIPRNQNISLRTTLQWTVLSFLLVIGINSSLLAMGFDVHSANNEDIIQELFSANMWFMMVGIHMFGPILEEMLFRGIFLESLIRLYPDNKYFNLSLSAFIFAFAHTYTVSFSLLDYFVGGLLYSVLYYRSRRLRDSVIAHILTNILITVILMANLLM
ncbi:CPBP family intramembrane glutamic endopeptidase [Streptococcus ictaluri]|uniref:CAAX amino terminal protease family protein n=1 Tax=Streptococcus ictaluri 707-05 TaxID=764299 RepID=G5K1T2_9STRE|nr:CPBP family intramembrane glutamic endopeptidase [Streptococcus ictaluri]EHI70124.1 CAAX amino terminal protease family protein [Streptococcus ictaluri 707-05]